MDRTYMIMEMILAFGNICIMLYALKVFVTKPRTSLEERVTTLEVKQKETEQKLLAGNDNFRSQREMNEVFVNCMLAFIDFEIAFCQHSGYEHSADLIKAKSILQDYLARK